MPVEVTAVLDIGSLFGGGVVPVAEGEVRRVVGHRLLGADADGDLREGEALAAAVCEAASTKLLALTLGGEVAEGIGELHVFIERIVLRGQHFVAHRVVDGEGDLRLGREELAELERGGELDSTTALERAAHQWGVDSAEACRDVLGS